MSTLALSQRIHPFSMEARRLELPAGGTLAEILAAAEPNPVTRATMHVRIGGHDIPAELWRRVRPKPGVLIEAVPLPMGGQDTFRTVLMIAIVAGALATGAWAAGALAGAGYFAAGGAAYTFASAGIGGALPLPGPLALGALLPPMCIDRAEA